MLSADRMNLNGWLRLLTRVSRRIDDQVDSLGGRHSARVAHLAHATALRLGFSLVDARWIYWAARFHDIGKVAAPRWLLSKGGPLDEREWQIIRLHPAAGANIVESCATLAPIAGWIYHHQEKFDGTGYPDGLRGERIPLPARLLTVADAYDAMTHHRCYRPALGPAYARGELQSHQGSQFDPLVVEAFLQVVAWRS